MPEPSTYPQTSRTTASRKRDRMHYQRAAVHAVLDEAYHCHLAFVRDGEPQLLPTLHARVEETLYLHGSTGSAPLLTAHQAGGLRVCLAVTLLDGLVFARSQLHHSANYRSVVVHGTATPVTEPAHKRRALDALLDKAGAGRSRDCRPPTAAELAGTAVLALPLQEASLRIRTGGVNDDPADLDLPYWAGVVPLTTTAGAAQPAPGVTTALPAYLPGPRPSPNGRA